MSRRVETALSVGEDEGRDGATASDGRAEPLRIAVAPTIRLSEEIPRPTIAPTWTSNERPRFVGLLLRPKPRSRRARLWRFFQRVGSPSFVDRRHVVISHVVYRRSNFTRRVRERSLSLFLFTGLGALLSFFTPFGLLICALGLAVSWAELKVGWACLSRTATQLVWGSIGLAVVGILAQAIPWIAKL